VLSWCAVRQGVLPLAIRGAWAVGRMGNRCSPATKRLLPWRQIHAGSDRLGHGARCPRLRHSRLHAEVSKALAAGRISRAAT